MSLTRKWGGAEWLGLLTIIVTLLLWIADKVFEPKAELEATVATRHIYIPEIVTRYKRQLSLYDKRIAKIRDSIISAIDTNYARKAYISDFFFKDKIDRILHKQVQPISLLNDTLYEISSVDEIAVIELQNTGEKKITNLSIESETTESDRTYFEEVRGNGLRKTGFFKGTLSVGELKPNERTTIYIWSNLLANSEFALSHDDGSTRASRMIEVIGTLGWLHQNLTYKRIAICFFGLIAIQIIFKLLKNKGENQ